ncbi:MAG: tetratricopeptide repeat protein [Sedimentisphaerales bacterium]
MLEFTKKNASVFVYATLILSTFLVFWQVRNFDCLGYDDKEYVFENPHVYIGLTADSVIWAFTAGHAANWHPLTWFSHILDCQFFGKVPGPMHLVNLFLHLTNTLLLFAILKKMTGKLWPSAFVAAAFALHPMHVESVAWIAERKDVLSTLFWLLTILAYVRYVEKHSASRYIAALIVFALGLMSKPMLVTLPFVLLFLDYWPLNRFQISNRESAIHNSKFSILNLFYEKAPFFVLAAISSVITFLVQRAGGAIVGINVLSLKDRLAIALLSYTRYIGKLFWPQNLAAFYPPDVRAIQFWQVASCILLLTLITILVIRLGRNCRYLPVGWFWFIGTLLPVIGLVPVGASAYADRYTYIPYIGLFIMLAWGLPQLFLNWPYRKFALGISAALVLMALGTGAYRQTSFWNNDITLFSHAVEVTHNNSLAYYNLGTACLDHGRYQDAAESLKQAVRIKPDYTDALFNLGCAFDKLGRFREAIESYKQAIKINPDFAKDYSNIGVDYCNLGRIDDAINSWQQAVRIKPDFVEVYSNLGAAFYKLGRYQDAIESLKQAIKINPDFADAHSNLGFVYLAAGDKNSALEEYRILKTLGAKKADQLYNLIYR